MNIHQLEVQKREILGKKVQVLRREGFIPAELYGHNFPNLHLAVPAVQFSKVFRGAGESTIIKLKVKSEEGRDPSEINVLVHDVGKNPLTDQIEHIDFYQVRMDEKIRAAIPLKFFGESSAVKEKDGILVRAVQELDVEALPQDLPPHIEVDIRELSDIGASIHIKDLKLKPGVKILADPDTVLATVTEPVKEEVPAGPATVEEVKVEGEEKKKEEVKGEDSGKKKPDSERRRE